MGMEFTNNPATSKRVLLPLEPDFSSMSDPSVILEPPNNNWRSDNRQAQTFLSGRISRRDQSRNKHKSKKRRRCRSSSTSSCSRSASSDFHKRSRKSKDPNIPTRRGEEDIHLLFLLLLYLIISHMIIADTKVDIVRRLHRILAYYSLQK